LIFLSLAKGEPLRPPSDGEELRPKAVAFGKEGELARSVRIIANVRQKSELSN